MPLRVLVWNREVTPPGPPHQDYTLTCNGLGGPATADVRVFVNPAVDITESDFRLEAPGPTFDGRDLFGPLAAHLAAGAPLDAVGTPLDPALLLPAVIPVSGGINVAQGTNLFEKAIQ